LIRDFYHIWGIIKEEEIISGKDRDVAMLHDRYQEEIPRKISLIILDASEFRNLEVKDRPLYERINMGKVIHEA
jgi:hypothetical protein